MTLHFTLILQVNTYHTVKNIGSKKTLVNYSNSPSFFTNFDYFHNIPYANGLQFTKVFSANSNFLQLTSLLAKLFYRQSFLLYGIYNCIAKYVDSKMPSDSI